jgi:hypothetical protein
MSYMDHQFWKNHAYFVRGNIKKSRVHLDDAHNSLPKLASQFFGAEFYHRGLSKILARICEGRNSGSMGSQKIGSEFHNLPSSYAFVTLITPPSKTIV